MQRYQKIRNIHGEQRTANSEQRTANSEQRTANSEQRTANSRDYSVAVITSTVGKPELEQAIRSVQAQTYPCRHYVFVDGNQFAERVKPVAEKYPDVIFTYLPMNTGANGWTNSSINAIAPFLIKEDIICYLDDDNWYEPDHVAACVAAFERDDTQYVWAMRNFVQQDNGEFICPDFFDSLGFFERKVKMPVKINIDGTPDGMVNWSLSAPLHIDTNCYAVKRTMALRLAQAWHSGIHNDRNVFAALKRIEALYQAENQPFHRRCTNRFSVNYRVDANKFSPGLIQILRQKGFSEAGCRAAFARIFAIVSDSNKMLHGNQYPWESDLISPKNRPHFS